MPIYLENNIHKALVILSQELGTSLSTQVTLALINWIRTPGNRELLMQTEYSRVSEIDKIFV